jgi:ferritin-like metal-binding protein YciE
VVSDLIKNEVTKVTKAKPRKAIMKTLKTLFLDELADMYDAEHRITKALPKMAKAATCTRLQAAFLKHLQETEGQISKLERVFASIGEKAKGKKCEATVGLLKEGDEIAAEFKNSPAINAALIAAGQKVEHYEIASYGCLHEWAGLLGYDVAANLLNDILAQEKGANDKLTELAESGNNEKARDGGYETSSGRQILTSKKLTARATSKRLHPIRTHRRQTVK